MRHSLYVSCLGGALIIGGAAFFGCYYRMQYEARRAQQDAQVWLNRAVKASPRPSKSLFHRGDVVGRLSVPRINLSVMVFEGDDDGILKLGAGRIPSTSFPNEKGNLGIAAHRDTYFRPLRLIRPRDVIEFTTPDGISRYSVTDIEIVRPSDVQVLDKAPGRNLTLVTCYPFYFLGSAPKRWIVHATRIV